MRKFQIALLLAVSSLASASSLNEESAKSTIIQYLSVISAANDFSDFAHLRSPESLAQDQEAEQEQEAQAVPPEVRQMAKRHILRMMKEMAKSFTNNMAITCQPQRCTAKSLISPQWRQSIDVVEVNGQLLIGNAHAELGDIK